MGKRNDSLQQILTTVVAAAGMAVSVGATAKVGGVGGPPRGSEIQPIAGMCTIGSFHQTTKTGQYNALCTVMSDAEKCFAFIKGHFDTAGDSTKTSDPAKMTFCLDELGKVLGANETL
jgi:hypothetical protein